MKTTLSLFLVLSVAFTACEQDACIAKRNARGCVCYEIYAPVCGCDGVTYPNDCYAECAGVKKYTFGECN